MKLRLYLIRTITLFTVLISLTVYGSTNQRVVRISKIKIKGAKAVSLKEIKENMATEFPSIKPWVTQPEFDEEVLKDDMVRIERLYSKYGYYDAHVTYKLKYNKERDRVEITINIKEGKPVILEELNLDIRGEIEDRLRKEILERIPIKVGRPFSAVSYQATKGTILDILSTNGYPKATIEGEALINRKNKWAHATLIIDPGPLYRFGDITVTGNKEVEEEVIRREITFKEGDIYSTKHLSDTQGRIFQLGLFSSVVIDTKFNEKQHRADINIRVKERKLGTLKIGVGYGTEDLLRGQLVWTQRNLFGGGRKLEASTKLSFITQRFETQFSQPYIAGKRSEFTGSFNLQRDILPSFSSDSITGSAGIKKGFLDVYSAFGTFNVQISKLSDISSATEEFIRENNFFLTFFNFGLERNTTDSILNPTRGTLLTTNLETSFKTLGSDVNYLKGFAEARGYKKISKLVLAKRLGIGFIEPFGTTRRFDIPLFKRFFAGGSTSMRGFPFQKLGPLDENNEPIGGNSILLGSFELRFPIYRNFGGVAFLDYGNVFPKEFDIRLDELKYAVGTGLRYNTLIGPLRIDIGYALNPEPGIGRFQFFLSIGQAF
ncbi:Outer membrane protein assembly factor BamA [bacterium HR37]|nr:Outer membrane protein assembly factor BamA [bacterium HR37]